MDVITISDKRYLSIDKFMEQECVTKKTVYNRVKDGRVEIKRVFNKSFFRIKD